MANQVIGTSVSVDWNSEESLKITIAQIIIKLNSKVKFEKGIFFTVFLIRLIRTNVMIINGITVTNRSMILKILAEFPSKILFVESRVNIGRDPAPCSNAAQKKIVKNEKIEKAIILSLTIGEYLGILNTKRRAKLKNAVKAKNNESDLDKIVKFKISISAILLSGALIIKMRAEIMNIKIKK